MTDHDWTKFTKRIPIFVGVNVLYRAFATAGGLESWFLRKCVFKTVDGSVRLRQEFAEKSDTYEFLWHGWSDEVIEKGSILEANGKDIFKFTFTLPMTVTVEISEYNGYCMCELTQENISIEDSAKAGFYVGCGEGWVFYLTNLKSVLEGGIDLRNRDISIGRVINS